MCIRDSRSSARGVGRAPHSGVQIRQPAVDVRIGADSRGLLIERDGEVELAFRDAQCSFFFQYIRGQGATPIREDLALLLFDPCELLRSFVGTAESCQGGRKRVSGLTV